MSRGVGFSFHIENNSTCLGYPPSARVLAEGGGIETMGLYYGGVSVFTRKVEQTVLDKARELARNAGRKLPP